MFACRKEIDETLNRGVRIRVIVDKPHDATESSLSELNALRKNSGFQIRFLPTKPPALIYMLDNETAHLSLRPSPFGVGGFGPLLFSNHPGFVGLVRIYFDSLWAVAEEGKRKMKIPTQTENTKLSNH